MWEKDAARAGRAGFGGEGIRVPRTEVAREARASFSLTFAFEKTKLAFPKKRRS